MLAYFEANPQSSQRCAEHELGVSRGSIQVILKKHKMHDYKFAKVQALNPEDFMKIINFWEMVLIKLQEDPNFLSKVM